MPATACERFHLNFWQGNFPDTAGGLESAAGHDTAGGGRHRFRVQTTPVNTAWDVGLSEGD